MCFRLDLDSVSNIDRNCFLNGAPQGRHFSSLVVLCSSERKNPFGMFPQSEGEEAIPLFSKNSGLRLAIYIPLIPCESSSFVVGKLSYDVVNIQGHKDQKYVASLKDELRYSEICWKIGYTKYSSYFSYTYSRSRSEKAEGNLSRLIRIWGEAIAVRRPQMKVSGRTPQRGRWNIANWWLKGIQCKMFI